MTSTASKPKNLYRNNQLPTRPNIKESSKFRKDSPAISGSELIDMLSPITPASFTAEYWGRKSLLIKGNPKKLQKLFPGGFERKDFYRAVRETAGKNVKGFQLGARGNEGLFPAGIGRLKPYVFIEPDQMEWMFASGANVTANNISDQRFATFAAALKAQLNCLAEITVTATLSPKGNGWLPHVDPVSAIFIQCEGRKRFVISQEPIVQWPDRKLFLTSNGTVERYEGEIEPWEETERVDMESLIEVVLEPGDILFLPPGTVHATEALSESTLTMALMFQPVNFFNLISRVLERMLKSDPGWRHLPSVNSASVKPGELPDEAAEFFSARLAELRDAINALTPETPELNRLWQKLIADPGELTLANLSLSSAKPNSRPIRRKDLLRVSRKAPITYALGTDSDGEASLDLYFADKEVSVAGEWVPFLKTMVEKQRFTAESATKWAEEGKPYPWKVVRESLEALLDQGILEREAA
jgi:ribosomal protein L16 Arg81 hydroxylase